MDWTVESKLTPWIIEKFSAKERGDRLLRFVIDTKNRKVVICSSAASSHVFTTMRYLMLRSESEVNTRNAGHMVGGTIFLKGENDPKTGTPGYHASCQLGVTSLNIIEGSRLPLYYTPAAMERAVAIIEDFLRRSTAHLTGTKVDVIYNFVRDMPKAA